LHISLDGFKKAREEATITSVGNDIVGSAEVGKYIGNTLADALRLPQGASWVIVRAKLPKKTFEADRRTYQFHHGMPSSTAEVKVQNKPFLSTIVPALEKYLPE
jgi:membrane fusion protein (multidrug efflux system)